MKYLKYMKEFVDNLKELMDNKGINVPALAKELGFERVSTIYSWFNAGKVPKLDKALAIANYFKCNLDFLFGRSEECLEICKTCPPFGEQFKKVLKEQGVSQNKLMRELNFSGGNIFSWTTLKANPRMDSVIKVADYLGVSLDYLVGREK